MKKQPNKQMEQLSFDSLFEEDDHDQNESNQFTFDSLLKVKESEHTQSNPTNHTQTWRKKLHRRTFPINLVTDFDQLIAYIVQHSIRLTKTKGYIPMKHLPLINEMMSNKAEGTTSQTQQEYYPYIHFLYSLALNGRLLEKYAVDSGNQQFRVTNRYNEYNELTDTEKYFFLLETFWVDTNWAKLLNQSYNPVYQIFPDFIAKIMDKKRGNRLDLDKETLLSNLTYHWNYFFLYLEWFGFWYCERDSAKIKHSGKKTKYFAKSITLTPFGRKIVPKLMESRNLMEWNIPLLREHGVVNPLPGTKLSDKKKQSQHPKPNRFHQAFSDLFPKRDLHNSMPRNERAFIPGAYTLKISLRSHVWRKVVLSANHTMHDLHRTIIKAFHFDDDHLYSFFMDGKKWSNDCIVSPGDDSGSPNAMEVMIGPISLYEGQQFMYLYDYGDEWMFTITVEYIKEADSNPVQPVVMEEEGTAPEQYYY